MKYGNDSSNEANCLPEEALLCKAASLGDNDAMEQLVHRYSRLVKTCARPYFLAGADGEDLIQEGMVGLLRAIREYDASKSVPFEAFARLCITRRLYSAVRAAASHKHEMLNHSISIEKPLFDDNAEPRPQVAEPISDPESLVIGMEEHRERLKQLLGSLSIFEAKVLRLYLDGYSYEEMAGRLDKPIKSVDNAIQRIRRKSAAINP
ncbi:sigma-70 family RNA polymerase sigma factor [Intestinibacillus massiliensis]|nr:sigma-70 family RNA polymerase sigma factor [Intestinibacillus massiliensis]